MASTGYLPCLQFAHHYIRVERALERIGTSLIHTMALTGYLPCLHLSPHYICLKGALESEADSVHQCGCTRLRKRLLEAALIRHFNAH